MTGENKGYCFSLKGLSHEKSGLPCQDSSLIYIGEHRFKLAIVADGVGSAPCSDIGSKMAVETVLEHCKGLLDSAEEQTLLAVLKESFALALTEISKIAEENDRPIEHYDTTLTACLFDGKRVIIGHAGDGGAIGVDSAGRYHMLTQVQKGEAWNEVCPLRTGESKWVFQAVEGEYSAVLLFTDGLLDHAVPSLLFGQENPLYCGFISKFLPMAGYTPQAEQLQQMLRSGQYDHLSDDLSAAALWIGAAQQQAPPAGYLDEPDWEGLRRERYYKLYPHLKPREEEQNAHEEPAGND